MGAKRNVLTIDIPIRAGIMSSGHKQDIPENSLWQAQNVSSDIDGIQQKRPSLTQWGQTIKEPDKGATGSTFTSLTDFLSGSGSLVAVDGSAGLITTGITNGRLQFNVPAGSGGQTYTYYLTGSTASTKWGLRSMIRGKHLPNYTPGSSTPNALAMHAIGAAGTGKEFVLWGDGLYYKRASDSKYTKVQNSDQAGVGAWVSLEILYDDSGNTLVYLDEKLADTITSSLIADVTLTAGAVFEFVVRVEGTGAAGTQYNAWVAMPMYNDTVSTPFAPKSITAVTDFVFVTKAGTTRRTLVAAAGNYIYTDQMEQAWLPLIAKTRSNVFFTTYQRTLVWSDNDGGKQAAVWQWDGLTPPALLTKAPQLFFMTEHQFRLAGVDPANPLTILVSGSRQPNEWLDPNNLSTTDDLFDLLADTAVIPIPAKKGDAITGVFGDYYGTLIVFTRSSVWRVSGKGVFSYTLTNISQNVGCVNPESSVMVGNDIWFAGYYGINSLQAVSEFGDIQSQNPSVMIQSMWQPGSRSPITVNRDLLSRTRMCYVRTRGLVLVHLPIASQNQLMVYNVTAQHWLGPWDVESLALSSVELETPLTEVSLHGGATGRIAYADFANKADYGVDSYTTMWDFASLNGRSLDPTIIGMMKSWKIARLYYLPRGKFDFTLNWYASIEDGFSSETHNQAETFKCYAVDDDMRVDLTPDGQVYSNEELMVTEIPLNVRGYALDCNLVDNGLGQDFVPVRMQVEFTPDGYEVG
jgi:hypothetical protein